MLGKPKPLAREGERIFNYLRSRTNKEARRQQETCWSVGSAEVNVCLEPLRNKESAGNAIQVQMTRRRTRWTGCHGRRSAVSERHGEAAEAPAETELHSRPEHHSSLLPPPSVCPSHQQATIHYTHTSYTNTHTHMHIHTVCNRPGGCLSGLP